MPELPPSAPAPEIPAAPQSASPASPEAGNERCAPGVAPCRPPTPEELAYLSPVEAALHRTASFSTRGLLFGVCGVFAALLVWAGLADLEEAARGTGQVIPSQRVQQIQNLEGGILRELFVREGQEVEKDAPLARIDNEQAAGALRDAVQRSLDLTAAIARLRAEISGNGPQWPAEMLEKNPDVIRRHQDLLDGHRRQDEAEFRALEAQRELRVQELAEQRAKKKAVENALQLAVRQRNLVRPLLATKSYSEVDFLNLEQRVSALQGELAGLEAGIPKSEAALREAEERLTLRKAELDNQDLTEINRGEVELAGLRELIASGGDRVTRTELRAPVRAVVKRILITTPGGVIRPGEVVMDLVPLDDTLLVEARISPQDIAFIYPGQRAVIRLSAYDFAIYGALDAVVEQVGADTVEGRNGDVFYPVKLRTKEAGLKHKGETLPILPGMVATVDIITGKKTVLDYLLKPILKARQTALRER